ncbi:MAG: sulfotransferase [Gammaproteobacteria bacterium]|nr:sulfotransferase [Gammaproteobacteria bacterium]
MLRSSLNAHPKVHLAGETHYFDDLRVRLAHKLEHRLEGADLDLALRYFRSLGHRPYGHGGDPEQGRFSSDELLAAAQVGGGSSDAMFAGFCRLEAESAGKSIAGEKTPRHVFRIDEMLAAFPEARVICMTRDPRAIVASYRDWRNQGGFDFEQDPGHLLELAKDQQRAHESYHPATIAFLWRAQMNAAAAARRRYGDGRVWVQRYEDLVAQPEVEIAAICTWLGLEFTPLMMRVPVHNSSYASFDRDAGIRTEAVSRWTEKLDSGEIRLVERVCAGLMTEMGYATERFSGGYGAEIRMWLSWPQAVLSAIRANRSRSGSIGPYVLRRLRLAMGR